MPREIRTHDPSEGSTRTQELHKRKHGEVCCVYGHPALEQYIIRCALRYFVIYQCAATWKEFRTNFNTVNPRYNGLIGGRGRGRGVIADVRYNRVKRHLQTYIVEYIAKLKKKLNSVAFSAQANYTDRATAACWRS
jgi:hypothetical protein